MKIDMPVSPNKFGFWRARTSRRLYDALREHYNERRQGEPLLLDTMAKELGSTQDAVYDELTSGGMRFYRMCDFYVAMGSEPFCNVRAGLRELMAWE